MNTNSETHTPGVTEASPVASDATTRPATLVRPRVDMFETETSYLLRAEIPGADESNVEVRVERDILSLTADVDFPVPAGFEPRQEGAARRRYERSFRLADDVDAANIDASVRNGLLTLTIPKVQPSVLKVAVKRGS